MAPLPPDPYLALGVSKDAQLAEIRSAHRKLVLKCHPDKVQDPLEKQKKQDEFQRVQQAYEILSSEYEREKYDVQKEVHDLKEEKRRNAAAASTPASSRASHRSGPQYYQDEPDIHDVEPRASTFSSSPSYRVYPRTPPRSREEMPRYEERSSRKSAQYEREQREREREREERQWRKEQEKSHERQKKERKERKLREEMERKERDDRKKRQEKERKRDADEKRRHKTPEPEIVDASPDEENAYVPPPSANKSEKKKSKKSDESLPRESSQPPSNMARERKHSINRDFAQEYLSRSGAKVPSLTRASTMDDSLHYAPTPPPVGSPFAPPTGPEQDDEAPKRSSGKSSRRTGPSARDKSVHKKSGTRGSSRGPQPMPPTPGLQRAHTEQYTRTPPAPMDRANTWADCDRSGSRERAVISTDEESSEDERPRRRSRRQAADASADRQYHYKYKVRENKSVPMPAYEDASPRSHRSKNAYHTAANTSARMSHPSSYESYGASFPGNVNMATQFAADNIQWSRVPHTPQYLHEEYSVS